MPDFIPYTRQQLEATLNELGKAVYTVVAPLEITAWRTAEPVPYAERLTGQELNLRVGDAWGELFDCAWFRFRAKIPASAAGQPVVALLDVNGEMCIVDDKGMPLRGLTNIASEFDRTLGRPGKRVLPLTACASGGESIELWADAGCNDLFGYLCESGTIKEAALAVGHPERRALYYDFEVLLDSLKVLPENSARYQQIVVALHEVARRLENGLAAEGVVRQARERLAVVLQKRGGDPSLTISAIGHAHIDLAWLWPIRETKRKGARTFATALAQLTQYPEYVFAASQAQLFQWMKESYPSLYAQIKARVKEGRLEPQGAMWVECDVNLVNGESLIRQILHGRRFFREEFGVDVAYAWLPDTFGFTAALPQILKLAGIRYFATQKLSWSLVNQFPHHSFHWQGIDGSQVLAYLLPEETYNGPAAPRSIGMIEANYRDKGVSDCALMVFGIGDGGGGPGEEHLERLARLKNFAGLSPVKQEWVATFFEHWSKDAANFATWVGELYLERHQGTLTTNARNKWYNRRMENSLRDWEWLAAWVSLAGGQAYPAERLREIWLEVLLYQFHDILPGSSIKRVYDETTQRYQKLLAEVETSIQRCQAALAHSANTSGMRQPFSIINSLSWERTEWLRLGEAWHRVTVPPLGYVVVDADQAPAPPPGMVATRDRLENDRLRVQFEASGAIISIYDKVSQREVLAPGEKANRLAVYRDSGNAWDFPLTYTETEPQLMQLISAEARVEGPRAVLVQDYRLGHSTLTQEITLVVGRSYLEFATQADWRETGTMLRAAFPVAVQAAEAAYETQFGHFLRSTHRNTTWDLMRDEVAAYKWADLSQRDYGVALLNDSKYGYKIKGHTIDLNLIRSVPYPGANPAKTQAVDPGQPHPGYTDQTNHAFRYAVYPHSGDRIAGGVVRAGYEFNFPLRVLETDVHAGPETTRRAFIHLDSPQVVVETVKKAEAGEGWIVRLYEASGGSAQVTLHFSFAAQRLEVIGLMEDPIQPLEVKAGSATLAFRPFEIKTLRVSL